MGSSCIQQAFKQSNSLSADVRANPLDPATLNDPVFLEWCFWHETQRLTTFLVLILPPLSAAILVGCVLQSSSLRCGFEGVAVGGTLFAAALITVVVGAAVYVSAAVSWEVNRESRDLIRLTGLNPTTLLMSRAASRWSILIISILLMLPWAMYANTLGGVSRSFWVTGQVWIIVFAILMAGFAMIASVTLSPPSNTNMNLAISCIGMLTGYHILFGLLMVLIPMSVPSVCILIGVPFAQFDEFHPVKLIGDFAPIAGIISSFQSPDPWAVLRLTCWLHAFTGLTCIWAATRIINGRFLVTTESDEEDLPNSDLMLTPIHITPTRPRCVDNPFFWKDIHIHAGGMIRSPLWTFGAWPSWLIVLMAFCFGRALELAIAATILAPLLLAIRFESFLTAEFREKTWSSLMMLPIDPRIPVFSMIQAAVWVQRPLFWPISFAALLGLISDFRLILSLIMISTLFGVFLLELSLLDQLNQQSVVQGIKTGISIVLLATGVIAGLALSPAAGIVMAIGLLLVVDLCFYRRITRRLQNWCGE